MNTANGWRRIVPALGKAQVEVWPLPLDPGCRPAKGGARAGTGIGVMPAVTDSGYRAAGAVRHP